MWNNRLLWGVKLIAAIFNAPATGYVFYNVFSSTSRSSFFVYFNVLCAVLLIDAFFLWVLYELEDDSIDPRDRIPEAIVAFALTVGVIVIGAIDEGMLAWIPRMGIVALVLRDELRWINSYVRVYRSREYQEQRIRDQEVVDRRKLMQKAKRDAWNQLETEFIQVQVQRERKQLGLVDLIEENYEQDLPERIVKTDEGYGWVDFEGELTSETSTGNPYTLTGAKLALARYTKKAKTNGHLQKAGTH